MFVLERLLLAIGWLKKKLPKKAAILLLFGGVVL